MSSADLTERTQQLITRMRHDGKEAFAQLYDLYADQLYNYGLRLTNDRELVKDSIQDVFVKLYAKREELFEIQNFRFYLFVSLKNRICDEMRRLVFTDDVQVDTLQSEAKGEDVESLYLFHENLRIDQRKVQFLLSHLSKRQCQAITLYYVKEKKYEEICKIMDMNYQSVRNLVCRSMNKLRTIAMAI